MTAALQVLFVSSPQVHLVGANTNSLREMRPLRSRHFWFFTVGLQRQQMIFAKIKNETFEGGESRRMLNL